jgi:hypothetical protein
MDFAIYRSETKKFFVETNYHTYYAHDVVWSEYANEAKTFPTEESALNAIFLLPARYYRECKVVSL